MSACHGDMRGGDKEGMKPEMEGADEGRDKQGGVGGERTQHQDIHREQFLRCLETTIPRDRLPSQLSETPEI